MTFDLKNKTPEQIVEVIHDLDLAQAKEAFAQMDGSTAKKVIDIVEKDLLENAGRLVKEITQEANEVLPGMPAYKILEMDRKMRKEMREANKGEPLDDPNGFEDGFEQWIKEMIEEPKAEDVEKEAAEGRELCYAFNKITEIKGEAASPATKAILKEINKLSDDDRKDGDQIKIAVLKGYEKATKQGPKL